MGGKVGLNTHFDTLKTEIVHYLKTLFTASKTQLTEEYMHEPPKPSFRFVNKKNT
jgi:hypothetical protein